MFFLVLRVKMAIFWALWLGWRVGATFEILQRHETLLLLCLLRQLLISPFFAVTTAAAKLLVVRALRRPLIGVNQADYRFRFFCCQIFQSHRVELLPSSLLLICHKCAATRPLSFRWLISCRWWLAAQQIGEDGLVEAPFEIRVKSVLDWAVSAPYQHFSHFTPSDTFDQVQSHDLQVFLHRPLALINARIQVIVPSLSTLLSYAAWEVFRYLGPVSRAI